MRTGPLVYLAGTVVNVRLNRHRTVRWMMLWRISWLRSIGVLCQSVQKVRERFFTSMVLPRQHITSRLEGEKSGLCARLG